jgi:acetoacetyl-CoA reductase
MSSRVAVVTGGTGSIGTEICKQLADAGCRVAATCLPSEADNVAKEWQEARKGEGYDFTVVPAELSELDQAEAAVKQVEEALGPVDVLVNAAGITRDASLRKMTAEQWDQVMKANLYSCFNCTKAVFSGMLERGFGRIVNISSVNGQKGQFGQANYAATKAGMHGFTMSIAQEGARKGVTVNTVSPGYVATPMVMSVPEEIRKGIIAQIPVGRLAEPEEIARMVAFLAAEESSYITGADFSINGGLHMG